MYKGALGLIPSTHSNCLICMFYGREHGSTAVLQLLSGFACVKGLLQVTATPFIPVFIFSATLCSTGRKVGRGLLPFRPARLPNHPTDGAEVTFHPPGTKNEREIEHKLIIWTGESSQGQII